MSALRRSWIVLALAGCGASETKPSTPMSTPSVAAPSVSAKVVEPRSFSACPQLPPPAPSSSQSADASPPKVDVDAVIAQNRWRFKACYDRALARDPKVEGMVKIRVHVELDGAVRTEVICSALPDGLSHCIAESFASMVFPLPEGGPAQFTAPVVFSVHKKK